MKTRDYNKPCSSVYVKCHTAATTLGYEITQEEITTGTIDFRIGGSLFSFGENFRVDIQDMGKNITRVSVSSKSSWSIQKFDWGKNDENINTYFKTIDNLFGL